MQGRIKRRNNAPSLSNGPMHPGDALHRWKLRPAARLPAPSPRPAEPADGVRVRILSGWVRVCAVALLAGCSMMIDTHKGPAPDWPELRIVEHHVSSAAMREVCVRAQPWFAFGMVDACVYWRFATSWSTSGCTARGTTTPARTRRGGRGRPTSRGAGNELQPTRTEGVAARTARRSRRRSCRFRCASTGPTRAARTSATCRWRLGALG
jgi:hypothetical protein